MKNRDIVIGAALLIILGGLIFWRVRTNQQVEEIGAPTPSLEEQFEQKFNVTIPENAQTADLSDVGGGSSSGIAVRNYENGKFTLEVLADLPDLTSGKFYEVWLMGEDKTLSLGSMNIAKGGYLLDYQSSNDYSNLNTVVVSQEQRLGSSPTESILEGSF